ncbi:hypothetical protein H0W91_02285 [Patescibacteria group bacterium]|nr:hypothetical protein [Patescibacteria group bacterium]
MNRNSVIAIVVLLLLILGGILLFKHKDDLEGGPNATSTPNASTTNVVSNTQNPIVRSKDLPTVEGDRNTIPTNSSVVVTGYVTPNGSPTTYWYEYGTTNNLGLKTTVQSIGSGYVRIRTPGYITKLNANTVYYFRLVAQNSFGTTQGTTYSFSTNNNPSTQGNPPSATTNQATGITRTGAVLNGQYNPNGSQSTYWFEYGTDNNFGNLTEFKAAGDGSSSVTVSQTIANLNSLTRYYYRINVQNQYGTVNGATQSFITVGPAAATVPTVDTTAATNISASSARLNGRLTPNGAVTTYWFEYSENSLIGTVVKMTTPTQTLNGDAQATNVLFDQTNLNSNTKYFYRLVAKNQYGTVEGDMVNFRTNN